MRNPEHDPERDPVACAAPASPDMLAGIARPIRARPGHPARIDIPPMRTTTRMRTQSKPASMFRSIACLAVLGALLLSTGCIYNNHRSFGATEKWVHSDINYIPRYIGTPFVAIGDGIVAPFTAACDQWGDRPLYNPDHKYLSYAGSRVIARSDMGEGYQWLASVPSLVLDTLWLIVTGPVDLFTVLFSDQDSDEKVEETQKKHDAEMMKLEAEQARQEQDHDGMMAH
ncbi:MAG: hypothetical protein ABI624_15620 [Casimicrobiaceae bacterium]